MILTALLLVLAQNPAQDPRYERLDPDTRARVITIVDSARGGGLPDSGAGAICVLAPSPRDAEPAEFRRAVERAIARGAPPAAATSVRSAAASSVQVDATARGAQPGKP